ncbi:transglycosylase SLT domain-containing protein [Methylomagnum sp.]
MKPSLPLLLLLLLAGCASLPPKNPANICSIFHEKDDWYAATRKAQQRWGVPVPVQMAIINQESSFVEDARPPRYRFLGFIPLWRPTTAYGYGQATDPTWNWYLADTGHSGADRDDFDDATDFVGWYTYQSYSKLGIPKHDAYRQYLAYHEGHGGYKRGSHKAKSWLLQVARKVATNATRYKTQLTGCQRELDLALAERD